MSLPAEDRQLIQDAADRFTLDNYAFEEKEKRLEKHGRFGGNWADFAELGWLALPISEAAGGLGGGAADVQALMRAFGRGLIAEPYTEVVLLAGKTLEFCLAPDAAAAALEPIVCGEEFTVLAHGEQHSDPGFDSVSATAESRADGFVLSGIKRVVSQAGVAEHFLVTALLDGEPAVFRVASRADNLTVDEYPTIDSRYAADLHLREVVVPADGLIAQGDAAASGVKRAILFALAALAGEVAGIADTLVSMTAEYLNTREQFGQKIGGFQALQHMLADMVIAEEEAISLAWMAAQACELDNLDASERLIRTAKARSGKISRQIAETAVQLHGGIGVSDEFIVSHYLRRLIAVDAMFGDTQQQLIWLAQRY